MNSEELLKLAIKNNKIIDYFRGSNGYRISNYNGEQANAYIQNFPSVITSFHILNKKFPDWNIPDIMLINLEKLLESQNSIDIYTSLHILSDEILKEKTKYATYKLEKINELLEKLKRNLINNKEELQKIQLQGEQKSIWELADRYNRVSISKDHISIM